MDILTHTLSGVAAGTAVAACSGKRGNSGSAAAVLMGGLGGFLPDLDAISLWKGFDRFLGAAHGLNVSGREIYFGKWTFSHHGAMHSVLAGAVLAALIFFTGFILRYIFVRVKGEGSLFRPVIPSVLAFFFGYIMHLLGDLPTPGYVWGGIRLWWPADLYVGGTDQIWWWNNYDIFLAVLIAVVVNITILSGLGKFRNSFLRFLPAFVLALLIFVSAVMITNREYPYRYKSFRKEFAGFEARSKEEQKRILGSRLYKVMAGFDEMLPFNF
ncbi:MAG TPA: metal-dependent hydrolase [Spirochaetota bacterium]|nr:metal-dependent hydrolase [Spirochaetota bacterium]